MVFIRESGIYVVYTTVVVHNNYKIRRRNKKKNRVRGKMEEMKASTLGTNRIKILWNDDENALYIITGKQSNLQQQQFGNIQIFITN